RPARLRVHRLIAFAIGVGVGAPDVRRQRDVTDAIDRRLDTRPVRRPEADRTPPMEMTSENLSLEPCARALEHHPRARLQLLSRMDEREEPHVSRIAMPLPCIVSPP